MQAGLNNHVKLKKKKTNMSQGIFIVKSTFQMSHGVLQD
jgi:hypothetical protein